MEYRRGVRGWYIHKWVFCPFSPMDHIEFVSYNQPISTLFSMSMSSPCFHEKDIFIAQKWDDFNQAGATIRPVKGDRSKSWRRWKKDGGLHVFAEWGRTLPAEIETNSPRISAMKRSQREIYMKLMPWIYYILHDMLLLFRFCGGFKRKMDHSLMLMKLQHFCKGCIFSRGVGSAWGMHLLVWALRSFDRVAYSIYVAQKGNA